MQRLQSCSTILLLCCLQYAIAQPLPEDLPPIGTIDFYGLRTISEAQVLAVLPIKLGDSLPSGSRQQFELDMAEALGVAGVNLGFVCCGDAGLFQLYVGIQEQEQLENLYNNKPTGEALLADSIIANSEEFGKILSEAVMSGNAAQDNSMGHALSEYAPLRRIQERFIADAEQYYDTLVSVLHESANDQHRAIAAQVLGYAANKVVVAQELSLGISDPHEGVRNNATRALIVIAGYANLNSQLELVIPTDRLISMLNSNVWTDRNKAVGVLAALTQRREPRLLEQLRQQDLESLIEMCRWGFWGHAGSACLILRRIVGIDDNYDHTSKDCAILKAMELLGAK